MKEILRSVLRSAVENAARRNLINVPDPASLRIEISRSKDDRYGRLRDQCGFGSCRTNRHETA